jgi:hypothetical protein
MFIKHFHPSKVTEEDIGENLLFEVTARTVEEAIDFAKEILNDRLTGSSEPEKSLIKRMMELDTFVSDIFVCSFSAEKYSLSQWRAYCPQIGGVTL